jgi:hypothetical protein
VRPNLSHRVEDRGAVDEASANRTKSQSKVGRLAKRFGEEDHAIPRVGVEGVNSHPIELGMWTSYGFIR